MMPLFSPLRRYADTAIACRYAFHVSLYFSLIDAAILFFAFFAAAYYAAITLFRRCHCRQLVTPLPPPPLRCRRFLSMLLPLR